jgi:hypothetical protein
MLADTINHIFGIGYTMSADTNNVSGIRGVSHRLEILITVKFGFALSGCPIFLPSTPPPPSTPCRRRLHHQPHLRPQRHAITNPVPGRTFGLNVTGGVPAVIPNPIVVPNHVAPSLQRSVPLCASDTNHCSKVGATPSSRSITGPRPSPPPSASPVATLRSAGMPPPAAGDEAATGRHA